METLKAIEVRKSTRGFKPDPISEESLDIILKAANEAPVGMSAFDSIRLTVLRDAALIAKISDAATTGSAREGQDIYYGASTVIIVSSKEQPVPELTFANAGCIVTTCLLAATDIGIDNVYIFGCVAGFRNDPSLLAEVGIPEGFTPISSVALGYATEGAAVVPKAKRQIGINRR
ncbi:MAG: nitroreductase family protein [Clostridiales Family XIII bacterium]|jgi:nitroreductase|nr:nitroreductase family protein [Clostridiales Family XIII bacterium]